MTCVYTASLAQQPHASQLLQEIPENIARKYFGHKEREMENVLFLSYLAYCTSGESSN